MLQDTCVFNVASVSIEPGSPLLGKYPHCWRTFLPSRNANIVASALAQPFSSMRSECVCMRGVSGMCVCGRVSKYNRTIIYSAIWTSRLEGQTGICFNYLLLVSAASVTQA